MDDMTSPAGPGPFPPHAIAIVGLSGRFPGARGLDEFWGNIARGVESLEAFTDAELDAAGITPALRSHPHYVRRGTVLEDAEFFDAGFFGLSPREAQVLDPQQRIFLECAWEALEHAGHAPGGAQQAIGVYAGASMNTYLLTQIARDPALVAAAGGYMLMLGNDKDFLCTRVSYKLDLRGPSMTLQTACSTSLVAVQVACRALERHECDMALAGGVSVSFPQRAGHLHQEGMIFSPDGHCRPFDLAARGTRAGAGCGIVVLKRLADALADRDTIHAVIRGAAINNDGAGKAGYTAPSIDGQVEVIATAQALAGVEPRSIGYIEAHGTGTPLGDPIEIAALTRVFRASTADVGFCRLGSLKANLGHLDAAAGVAGLIKTVLALQHREIPPLVNFNTPNPQLELERSPFTASGTGSDWPVGETPRRAGVSSFGIGGTNAHVVLEEAPALAASAPARDGQLLLLSARTAAALEQAALRLADHLAARPQVLLADVAWTLQVGRTAFAHRRFVAARDAAQAIESLREPQPAALRTGVHEGGTRRVAFLFSGQGSQHAGMGRALYDNERVYREAVDRCAEALLPHIGLDLREVMFAAAGDTNIDQTRLAQPALFVTEYALAMLWREWGVEPVAMLGHSIGEYVAAHLAGVLSLDDALAVVAARGRLMQALPAGSMAAVHLGAEELAPWLLGGEVELGAVNGPSLCTVSGTDAAVAALLTRLGSAGVDSRKLHVSHAFHSAMMEPALAPFSALLETLTLSAPRVPYVSNVTGTWITAAEATSPAYYARHLRSTVHFDAGLRSLCTDPSVQILEVGPGNTLCTLAQAQLGKDGARRVVASLGRTRGDRSDTEALLDAVGRLWLAGAPIQWPEFHDRAGRRKVPLPTYAFQRTRHGVDAAAVSATPSAAVAPTPSSVAHGVQQHADVADWFFAPTWSRDDSLSGLPARLQGTWLVVGGAPALAGAVADQLRSAGARAVQVVHAEAFARDAADRYQVRVSHSEDIAAIAKDARAEAQPVAGAIVLGSLVEATSPARDKLLHLYHAQVALAAGLDVTPASPARIVVATVGAQSVLDEPVLHSDTALALGPVLALPAEVPGLTLRSIDLAPSLPLVNVVDAASALVCEAAADDQEALVARRAGRRWLRRFDHTALAPAKPDALPLRQRGVYLITGGLGGMGLALARDLALRVSARLLLTARSGLPPRTEWDAWLGSHEAHERNAAAILAIRAIEAAGGEVIVAMADAGDVAAMQAAVGLAASRWGPINGVIHAAGVPGTGRIAFIKSSDDLDAVLSPKAGGLDVLVELLGAEPLDFVALMGSINAVAGAAGACDYAAANAVLDAFVDSAQRPRAWRRVVCIDWGAWRDVGMAAKLVVPAARQAAWQAYLQTGIGTAAGVDAFARVLASGRRRLVVVPYNLNQALAMLLAAARASSVQAPVQTSAPATAGPPTDRAEHAETAQPVAVGSNPYVAPSGETQQRLAEIWIELLGVERVGVDDDFFELGGHSLMATRVLGRIEESTGLRLGLLDIFDAPTIRLLSHRMSAFATRQAALVQAADDEREEIEF